MDLAWKENDNARILIIDDEAAICDALSQYVETFGYTVNTFQTAEAALAFLNQNSADVVITDITLPGMNGLELTGAVKKSYDIDVIVMTGFSSDYSYEEAIRGGANDFIFKPVRFEELLLRLRRVLRERRLTQERLHMMEKLKQLSITDGLTKLFNSRYFHTQLENEINRTRRYQRPLSLLMMDIDRFKLFNDTYGHLEGDKVLVRSAQVIKSCLRKMDSAYRYGGEEFTVILPETEGVEAATVAERIRAAIEKGPFPSATPGEFYQVTISIGATALSRGEDSALLLQRADQAMYQSKQGGRNRVSCIFPNDSN